MARYDKELSNRKIRKRIRFERKDGAPVTKCSIGLTQKKHSFLFGCGGFVFIPYVAEGLPENREATESWLDVFNYATLPFYWGNYEREEGKTNRDALMKTAVYLKERGVTIKGHPLCWHTVCADWLLKYDNETIFEKQLARIEREEKEFEGIIDMWDVINETVIMPVFDKYDNAVTRICNEKGRMGLIKAVFEKAHEANPKAVLLLNDFNTGSDYEKVIDECLDEGVPISAIGIQSHQHQGYWGPEKLDEVLTRFERFGLPIHFTENTLISGDLMPAHIVDLNDWQVDDWPTTEEGEERQAEEVEEMYRILFSHPLVEAITTWDYKDGAWLGAPSGLVRKDNSKKPAYDVLKKLIREEWWTDTKVVTDENGFADVDAFRGDYIVKTENGQTEVCLSDETEIIKI
ncbi:MAG: endo-1,4-beta-xylanase [Lachnospiraceae bacterium]|nr:endo-1,4-beta-xylanase [Lachnospiraceae bacterium]